MPSPTELLTQLLETNRQAILIPLDNAQQRVIVFPLLKLSAPDKSRLASILQIEFNGHPLRTGIWVIDAHPPFSPEHPEDAPNAKLSTEDVYQIRIAYRQRQATQADLATRYGVSQALISRIIRFEVWRDLPDIESMLAPSERFNLYHDYWGSPPSQLPTLQDLERRYGATKTQILEIIAIPAPGPPAPDEAEQT